jgi:hypothetical protein
VDRRSLAEAQAVAAVQQTHARHILIKVTPTMSAADAKRKLLELKERLDNNAAKFEDLARLVSNDGSAAKGGDLGWLYPGDTMPEFETAMNNLKIGEVSEPVETSFGLHLIEVLERKSDDVSKERERNNARRPPRAQDGRSGGKLAARSARPRLRRVPYRRRQQANGCQPRPAPGRARIIASAKGRPGCAAGHCPDGRRTGRHRSGNLHSRGVGAAPSGQLRAAGRRRLLAMLAADIDPAIRVSLSCRRCATAACRISGRTA